MRFQNRAPTVTPRINNAEVAGSGAPSTLATTTVKGPNDAVATQTDNVNPALESSAKTESGLFFPNQAKINLTPFSNSEREPPESIPNSEVKPLGADDSAGDLM